jgi:hypothetical protein
VSYSSNLAAVRARFNEARDAGLRAAANVVANEVKRGLRGGYTSGAFVTGRVLASVNTSEPYDVVNGRAIAIGTDVMYALFWELGHDNIFTRKHERKEVWVPALYSTRQAQLDAYARAFRRIFGTGAAP